LVTRTIGHVDVTIESVKWPELDEEGAAKVDENGNTIYRTFTKDNPLKLYDEDLIQQYFVSLCYAKNYPFYVDVIFEQIQ
jgi:hypothetical protein